MPSATALDAQQQQQQQQRLLLPQMPPFSHLETVPYTQVPSKQEALAAQAVGVRARGAVGMVAVVCAPALCCVAAAGAITGCDAFQ
jgi:hypothetical protein